MNLIYIANIRIPTEKAHGIQIMKMCEAFSKAGLKVELIVPWRFNKIKKDPFDYYGIKNNFKIRELPSLDLIPLNLPKIGFWIQNISFAISVFFYLLFKKAKIIYTRDFLSLLSSVFLKRDFVYEAHNFPKHFWLYQKVLKRIKGLIVITQKLKEIYQEKGINPEKILVAPDGVDLEEFNIKESQEECCQKLNLPLNKKIILYTGHLYKWKGADTLLEVARNFQSLICNYRNILFVFVGGVKKDIENFKKKAHNLNNVIIVGHCPHSEIPCWMRAADILILPNTDKEEISKYWTSPIKMFEYMASKKPIIASDLPSIREILNNNNSFLAQPDNFKKMTWGIKKVLENLDLSDKISKQAYQDVQKYTWKKRAKEIYFFIKPN